MEVKVGSLFTGIGGLDQAVLRFFNNAKLEFVCDNSYGSRKFLEHQYPDIPNLGDITQVDWNTVPEVDVLVGGSPCQDLSTAGDRKGMFKGTRSGLWDAMLDGIESLKPKYVIWENVDGARSAKAFSRVERGDGQVGNRALGRVLGDLSNAGYHAEWETVRASDVGAPHRRQRVFVIAYKPGVYFDDYVDMKQLDADRVQVYDLINICISDRRLFPTPTSSQMDGRKSAKYSGKRTFYDLVNTFPSDWEYYLEAIREWEYISGREAPDFLDGRGKLNTEFVEWMMGFPQGWVTDCGLSRTQQLKLLGNSVVPQQAFWFLMHV